MSFELGIQTAANGAITACIYAMMAVGVALVFGVMRMANFAHGEFYMAGAYAVWLLYAVGDWPFAAAVGAGIGVGAALGLAADRGLFGPLRGKLIGGYIASLGLLLILQVLAGQLWGVGKPKPVPPAFPGAIEILGAAVGVQRMLVIPVAVTMLLILWFFLHRTKLGRALRASAQDPEAAVLQGISVTKMGTIALVIGSLYAAVAGGLMAPIFSVTPYMGGYIVLLCFIIVIVGGLGSIEGAILASIIFGFLITFVTTVLDGVVAAIISVLTMLTMLAIRPTGLLGRVKV